jgi:hypothetical protein
MPGFLLSLILQVALIVHVLKTGRNTLWIWALLFLPLAGPLAYLVVEILPQWLGSGPAHQAMRRLKRTVDPNQDLRRAVTQAAVTDSVAAKLALGGERRARGQYREAIEVYRSGLKGLYEFDPTLLLGLAEAEFALGESASARQHLEQLREHNPDFKSPDAHLLYARALEAEGDLVRAEKEYQAVAAYYPGVEAQVRYGELLKRIGKLAEASSVFREVTRTAAIAPRHVQRAQAEWLAKARREG